MIDGSGNEVVVEEERQPTLGKIGRNEPLQNFDLHDRSAIHIGYCIDYCRKLYF